MRLDLYYLAERQQLNFELGTKANDGTYNNGAWWRGANPSTTSTRLASSLPCRTP